MPFDSVKKGDRRGTSKPLVRMDSIYFNKAVSTAVTRLRSSGIYSVAAFPQSICLLMDEHSANICPLQRKLKIDLPSVIKQQKQPVGETLFAIHAIFHDCVPACTYACVVM